MHSRPEMRENDGFRPGLTQRVSDHAGTPHLLASIARQMMSSTTVDVNGKPVTVNRTSKHRLRTLAFTMEGREYQAIEQNAEKASRWGQLARAGHQVVQFKDSETNRFVAVSVDGASDRLWWRAREVEAMAL